MIPAPNDGYAADGMPYGYVYDGTPQAAWQPLGTPPSSPSSPAAPASPASPASPAAPAAPAKTTNPNDSEKVKTIKDIINQSLAENTSEMPDEQVTIQNQAQSGNNSNMIIFLIIGAVGIGIYYFWRKSQ